MWNPQTNKFKDESLYLRRAHYRGDFTRIPEDAAVLRECSLL